MKKIALLVSLMTVFGLNLHAEEAKQAVDLSKFRFSIDEMKEIAANKPGFIKAMWCGCEECEKQIKELTGGVTSRCIPEEQEQISDVCVCCGKPARSMVYWGKAY